MKRIRSKLNNSQGVSIIIALVFMLICLFVGGVVLTSATVNAGRMKNIERNKIFMDHRSAAMLLADNLRTKDGESLKLEFVKKDIKIEDVQILQKGQDIDSPKGTNTRKSNTYTLRLSHDIRDESIVSPYQRLVVEAAMKYLLDTKTTPGATPSNTFVDINDTVIPITSYHFQPGDYTVDPKSKNFTEFSLKGTLTDADGNPFAYPITITCARGSKDKDDNSFDFFFMINQDNEEFPKIDVRMYSDTPVIKNLPEVVQVVKTTNFSNKNNDGERYTVNESVQTIVWQGPTIMKGDAPK